VPNTQAISSLFTTEALNAIHEFDTDVFKAALYKASANIGPGTTQYTASGEVDGLNYVPGGVLVASATPPLVRGNVTYWTPSQNIVYFDVTLMTSFNAVLIYNTSKSNRALGSWTFSPKAVNASTFTLRVPQNSPSTALLRWKQR